MPARRENEHGSAGGGYPTMAVVAFPIRLTGIFLAGKGVELITI